MVDAAAAVWHCRTDAGLGMPPPPFGHHHPHLCQLGTGSLSLCPCRHWRPAPAVISPFSMYSVFLLWQALTLCVSLFMSSVSPTTRCGSPTRSCVCIVIFNKKIPKTTVDLHCAIVDTCVLVDTSTRVLLIVLLAYSSKLWSSISNHDDFWGMGMKNIFCLLQS
jgi:hypothetical protein